MELNSWRFIDARRSQHYAITVARSIRNLAIVQLHVLVWIMVFSPMCLGDDFRVARIDRIGPADGQSGGPAEWAPDGSRIAFFESGYLSIWDTTGTTRRVVKVDMPPSRFMWSDDSTVILYAWGWVGNKQIRAQLVSVDMSNGRSRILEQYEYSLRDNRRTKETFAGPFRSVEGMVYYQQKSPSGGNSKIVTLRQSAMPPSAFHEIRVGSDALYEVSLDSSDSARVSNRRYEPYRLLGLSMSADKKYIMFGGNIVRLSDDKLIILDTLSILKPYPEGTEGCGFGSGAFNPQATEVVFHLSCDDGHAYSVDRVGLFDYLKLQFTILDPLLGLTNCKRPRFSPDGKMISLLSNGTLYVIRREMAQ